MSRIYVIRLSEKVLDESKFMQRNPNYQQGKPCFYVGMTGRSPQIRFLQHKSGYKSNKYAKKYGLWLAKKKFNNIPRLNYEEAKKKEKSLAEDLRQRGYGVWQN